MGGAVWPIAITPLGAAAAGTTVWRQADRIFVTVVVKATFALVAEGAVAQVDPEPIALGEEQGEIGLRSAGDLVPYLPQADVTLIGRAGHTRAPFTVRLAILRDGATLMSKAVVLQDPRIAGLGPMPRRAPVHGIAGAMLDIPEPFDWSRFQAARPDQRIDCVRGNEWIALAGVDRKHPVLTTHLAGVRGVAKVFGRAAALRAGTPLRLVGDTLHIDAGTSRCSIVWRAQFPISGADAVPYVHVVAGVEAPGRPLAWMDPFQQSAPRPAPSDTGAHRAVVEPRPGPGDSGAHRAVVEPRGAPGDTGAHRAVVEPRPAPGDTGAHRAVVEPRPAPGDTGAYRVVVEPRSASAALTEREWYATTAPASEGSAVQSKERAPVAEPPQQARPTSSLGTTGVVSPESTQKPVTPFAPARGSGDWAAQTFGVNPAVAQKPAIPFGSSAASAASAPGAEPPKADVQKKSSLGSTVTGIHDAGARPATPFEQPRAPAPQPVVTRPAASANPAPVARGDEWQSATLPLKANALSELMAHAALPFDAARAAQPEPPAAPAPPPITPPPMLAPSAPPIELAPPPPVIASAPEPPPTPPPAVAPPPPEASEPPAELGDQFLAALPEPPKEERLSPTEKLAARAAKRRTKIV